MPHIHTEPGQHDTTVSMVIIRTDTLKPSIILHMHRKIGVYMGFGGHIELNENPWQAIEHELLEESGYAMDQIAVLQPEQHLTSFDGSTLHPTPAYVHTIPYTPGSDHFHTDLMYAFVTREAPAHTLADGESADIRLFTAQEIREEPEKTIPTQKKQGLLFILEHIFPNWQQVSTGVYSTNGQNGVS